MHELDVDFAARIYNSANSVWFNPNEDASCFHLLGPTLSEILKMTSFKRATLLLTHLLCIALLAHSFAPPCSASLTALHTLPRSLHSLHPPVCSLYVHLMFLDASSHLYKRVCPSVGPSVVRGRSREFDWKRPRITKKVT